MKRTVLDRYRRAFVAENLRAGAKAYSKYTSIGGDHATSTWLGDLPDVVLAELGELFYTWMATLALPSSVLANIMSAIPKKRPGDHRLIAIIASVLRLFFGLVCREEVRQWDADIALGGDTAAPGRCCEVAAGSRHLEMEVATAVGMDTCGALWDTAAFYDTLDIPILIEQGQGSDFPPHVMVLACQLHLGPRFLRIGQAVSTAIAPSA